MTVSDNARMQGVKLAAFSMILVAFNVATAYFWGRIYLSVLSISAALFVVGFSGAFLGVDVMEEKTLPAQVCKGLAAVAGAVVFFVGMAV